MQKTYYNILGSRHCLYSNLQINKLMSSASQYSKYQLELIVGKLDWFWDSVPEPAQRSGTLS